MECYGSVGKSFKRIEEESQQTGKAVRELELDEHRCEFSNGFRCQMTSVTFQNANGSSLSILEDLVDETAKSSQGLLTPEEITGSPRRTPIEVLTSVPEEDEDSQKTRTSVDLRKWKEMVKNEEKKKKDEE